MSDRKHNQKMIEKSADMIAKIAKGLQINLEAYLKAKEAGKDVSKYVKQAKGLTSSKANWVKEMMSYVEKLDKDVELNVEGTEGPAKWKNANEAKLTEGANVKIGDVLYLGKRKGKVTKVMSDMANVDFGKGDVYGITFARIKGDKIDESKLTESREFVIIDPRGNARPVGMKVQGAQYVKKMGGPAKGYHMVLKKNALKARRAIEKNGGNATNSKIQNIMFDLMYEGHFNKSYIQNIIKEEYEKLNEERTMLTEKFGSKALATIRKRLGKFDGKKFFAGLSKGEGIQWDNVTDAAIGKAADLNSNVLNFMFVRGDLKGVFRGKKFVNFFAKPLENFSKGSMGDQYSSKDYKVYYTSYKRVLDDADEIITINMDIAKTLSTNAVEGRAAAKQGAIALKSADTVARENRSRYQELLRQRRDEAGFGQAEVEKLIDKANVALQDAIAHHVSQLKSGMIPQQKWNTQYQAAERLLKDLMDLFERYLKAGQEEAAAHKKSLELDKDASAKAVESADWYIDWAVKDAKKYVSDMRTKLKEYFVEIKNIAKAPMRAMGEY